jgi:predicted  nucleic acid-binding Zn-ribbon protein
MEHHQLDTTQLLQVSEKRQREAVERDIDQLQRRISMLEQELAEKSGELEERMEELEAARAANRELTRAVNQSHSRGQPISS